MDASLFDLINEVVVVGLHISFSFGCEYSRLEGPRECPGYRSCVGLEIALFPSSGIADDAGGIREL